MSERVCCLYRVSTVKQVDFDEANQADIPMQKNACRAFAAEMGWTIVYEEQEAGVSGYKVSAEKRDKLQLIKEYAVNGKFDILLVFMFDRIGRKADETPFVVEWFVRNGIRVWSVKEGEQRFDHHIDALLNYIRFWQADGESRKTSIRTKEGLRQLVRGGGWRGGIVPYGYHLEETGMLNKRKRAISKLVIDENESVVIRKIFNLCIGHGYGRCRIASELNKCGLKNRKGENWHEATVGHILHNSVYTGILHNGDVKSDRIEELVIIPPELFEQAQSILTERQNELIPARTVPLNTKGYGLVSGNVFCGHCGGRLVVTSNGKIHINAAGEIIRHKRIRYICYNKTRKRYDCDGQTGYTTHILDQMLDKVILQILEGLGTIHESQLLQAIHIREESFLKEQIHQAEGEYKLTLQSYEQLKEEVFKLLNGENRFSEELLVQLSRDLSKKMKSQETHLKSLRDELHSRRKQMAEGAYDDRKVSWCSIYKQSNMEVKKMIAGYLIKRLHVFRDYMIYIEINDIGVRLI